MAKTQLIAIEVAIKSITTEIIPLQAKYLDLL